MAEPGDPNAPEDRAPANSTPDDHSHDDLIGFTSPASLTGRERARLDVPRAEPEPEPEPEPPVVDIEDEDEPDLFDPPPRRAFPADRPEFEPVRAAPAPEPSPEPVPEPAVAPVPDLGTVPAWARTTAHAAPRPSVREAAAFGRAPAPVEGAMSLYAVYALILFAVPTLGVSALIALIAVTGRPGPEQALARSHFVFQQRTLWIAAVAAILGAVLIAVNLGVFVLFIMAVWVVVRGAAGLLALAGGKPIANPRTPLI